MLGGYQILDLRSIDLSRGTSESSISDASVLAQLLNIRDHIQKSYDFSKPLHAQLKPILIRYRDKKVGEKHEVALYGNIEVINVYYKFRIVANNEGEQLTINVEFEEKTDEYDNKYWDIKTAKILLTNEVAIFENITDKDGHKRFIEGEFAPQVITGYEFTYAKWCLSGNILKIVLAFNVEAGTYTTSALAVIDNIPKWILDKIFPGGTTEKQVSVQYAEQWVDSNNPQTPVYYCGLQKTTDTKLQLATWGSKTLSAKTYFRIAFDLLIDNESQD